MNIALLVNDNFSMYHFRKGLITTLRQRGQTVFALTPGGNYVNLIEGLGAIHRDIPFTRFIDPLGDLKMVWLLYRQFQHDRIDLLHNMTAKPAIYGAFAARLAGVKKVVALVSGNGIPYLEQEKNWKRQLIIKGVKWLYKTAFMMTDRIWFQNADDMAFYIENNIAPENKCILIRSGGINIEEFSPKAVEQKIVNALKDELDITSNTINVVMMVARLIWSKGVKEYVEAANIFKDRNSNIKLFLFAPYDLEHPDAVPFGYLEQYIGPNFQPVIGFRKEVREILSLADIVALPSYFREGVPRGLLEALAMGKPIVTTAHTGCREVVEHGRNGYLVPVKNSLALAEAISEIAQDKNRAKSFGEFSRRKVEHEFDEEIVYAKVVQDLYGGLADG